MYLWEMKTYPPKGLSINVYRIWIVIRNWKQHRCASTSENWVVSYHCRRTVSKQLECNEKYCDGSMRKVLRAWWDVPNSVGVGGRQGAEEEIWEQGRNRKFNMLSLEGWLVIYLEDQERGKSLSAVKGYKDSSDSESLVYFLTNK